jgi:anti-sigma B factor antagonist
MFNRHSSSDAEHDPHRFAITNSTCPDGTVRVSLQGELDVASAPELVEALDELRQADTWFVLDLRKLQFMDSTGLRAVIRVSKQANARGHSLRVIRGNEIVHKVFELTGADAMVEFVEP